MTFKKVVLVAVFCVSITTTGVAFAQMPQMPQMPFAKGQGEGLSPEKQAQVAQFKQKTETLSQQIRGYHQEIEREVGLANTNWDKVLAYEVEIAKLKVRIQQTAKELGLPAMPKKMGIRDALKKNMRQDGKWSDGKQPRQMPQQNTR
jgi:hypothetical protein